MKPLRVIWSVCAAHQFAPDYICRVIERAAVEGVSGVEVSCPPLDVFIPYACAPALAAGVDQTRLASNQAGLDRICETARRCDVRIGFWHRELFGPDDWLERMPELRAADGLIDLENPRLYGHIRAKFAEFFTRFPTVRELVLTLTETQYVVAHRPFSMTSPAERISRVIQAVADVTDRFDRQLVIRPFSAVREDELFVRDAINSLKARNVSVMYKTEPFDWNPFLPDEELIGSIPRYEVRAEIDAGSEYYGQACFPVCNSSYLCGRLERAAQKGASVAVIRVDRGYEYPSLGHPLNESNIMIPTRWAMHPDINSDKQWIHWLQQRHDTSSKELAELLEQSFEIVKKCFYIDCQSLSHRAFPGYEMAKHILVFQLFEENVSLGHLTEHWSILSERDTVSHAQIISEKREALELARHLAHRFDELKLSVNPGSREIIREQLGRLELLAESFLYFCKVIIAHLRADAMPESLASFKEESSRFLALADDVEQRFGAGFFRGMPSNMRSIVTGLQVERQLEIPLRCKLDSDAGIIDYVLCGFASEGHRLSKRLHSGKAPRWRDRFYRETGIGPEQGVAYFLKVTPGIPAKSAISFIAGEKPVPGVLAVERQEFQFTVPAGDGLVELPFTVPALDASSMQLRLFSSSPEPLRIAMIKSLR
jgi:hypothetical protein